VLQCVAVCYSVLQRVAACCSVLQCVAVCCSVLQRVAACCSVFQCVAVCSVLQCVAGCCIVLQCVAVRCSALQYGIWPLTRNSPTSTAPASATSWLNNVYLKYAQYVKTDHYTYQNRPTYIRKETSIYTKRDPHNRPPQPRQHRDSITCTWDNTSKETSVHMKRDLQNRSITYLMYTHDPHMWKNHRYEWNETNSKALDIGNTPEYRKRHKREQSRVSSSKPYVCVFS